jgi:hypothetical protein
MENQPVHQQKEASEFSQESVFQGKTMKPPGFSVTASPIQKKDAESNSLTAPIQRKQAGSFPEGVTDEQLKNGGNAEEGPVQRKADNSLVSSETPVQRVESGNSSVTQLRGGAAVGTLCVNTNVVGGGLTDGHAWLAYTPAGGAETTYGTWGNRNPIGLHRNAEAGYSPSASRCTELDATDKTALDNFASSNNSWGLFNNCASFAARGWLSVTGESIPYTSWGIPNPSALGTGIIAKGGTLAAGGTGGSSDSSGSSYGSSSVNGSATSSYNSSSL